MFGVVENGEVEIDVPDWSVTIYFIQLGNIRKSGNFGNNPQY